MWYLKEMALRLFIYFFQQEIVKTSSQLSLIGPILNNETLQWYILIFYIDFSLHSPPHRLFPLLFTQISSVVIVN